MNEESKILITLIQQNIKEKLESGAIQDANLQHLFIDDILQRLLLLKEPNITKMIKKYYEDQKQLREKIEQQQKQILPVVEEYTKNTKEIVDEIKRL